MGKKGLNEELLKGGFVWSYKKYFSDHKLAGLEILGSKESVVSKKKSA